MLTDTVTQPVIVRLDPEAALQPCDAHASAGVNAVVQIALVDLPTGSPDTILLCGHCARKHFGYEHTNDTPTENRQKGSDH